MTELIQWATQNPAQTIMGALTVLISLLIAWDHLTGDEEDDFFDDLD